MQSRLLLLVLSLAANPAACAILLAGEPGAVPGALVPTRAIEVRFSPHGGCTEAVVQEIGRANSEVLVQAYSFTSSAIADALLAAAGRGVQVRVIVDRSQAHGIKSQASRFRGLLVDDKHAIAHNKVIVIDGAVVLTGSFNFTRAAEQSNAENLLIIRDGFTASQYVENWKAHAQHSTEVNAK